MAKNKSQDASPKLVKSTKEMVKFYIQSIKVDVRGYSDGDVFKLVRRIQEELKSDGEVELTNPVDVYWWIMDYREELKKEI